jgi:hypothetical protein
MSNEPNNDFDILGNLNCNDDINVNEDYQTPEAPKPVFPGRYIVQVDKWGYKTDKNGTPIIKQDEAGNQYPILQIHSVKILEPVDCQRTVFIYQDIDTKPFNRGDRMVSKAADLLRAIDGTIVTSGGTKGLLAELIPLLNGGCILPVRLDWAGYEKDYANNTFDAAGGRDALSAAEVKSIFDASRIRGWRNIVRSNVKRGLPNKPTNIWRGPGGTDVECRAEITAFIGANEKYELGPDKEFQS